MNIHEYQAKELFAAAGIPVPRGRVAHTPAEARAIAAELGGKVVIKAQVHAGGRGKAGGIKLAGSPDEAEAKAKAILGMSIKGLVVKRVLVAEQLDIEHEHYLGIVLDRTRRRPVIMASAAGGIDIEEVARSTPEKIVRCHVDPLGGLRAFEAREICFAIESRGEVAQRMAAILSRLDGLYRRVDASLAEINPLVVARDGQVWALDAKVVLDDNALHRHPELEALREDEDPNEAAARRMGLSYIRLDGEIGCVVNGAGLAMATMDVIKAFGGSPANFLDIGGSSNPDKVLTAMDILAADSKVKAIFFNIFGGITRTDDVAQGIVQALAKRKPEVPIVIRLTGTNEERAREILKTVGLPSTTSMDEGVKEVIARAKESAAAPRPKAAQAAESRR
jgi:succinyl-CoA synthetase beta subunit